GAADRFEVNGKTQCVLRVSVTYHPKPSACVVSADDAHAEVDRGIAANAWRRGVKGGIGPRDLTDGGQQCFGDIRRKGGFDSSLLEGGAVMLETLFNLREVDFDDAGCLRNV